MQASADERVDALEKKVDELSADMKSGFKDVKSEFREVRAEFRAIRAELGSQTRTTQAMWLTMILGFAGILLNHL
jgi:hypothetical protein